MPVELKMPALSPTMEEGTLAKWWVKEGDGVKAGDPIAEIETDKATMEFEAIDEGIVTAILIPEGTQGVKVGTVIAILSEGGEDIRVGQISMAEAVIPDASIIGAAALLPYQPVAPMKVMLRERIFASPLARRIAGMHNITLAGIIGSGPNGRIVKADLMVSDKAIAPAQQAIAPVAAPPSPFPARALDFDIPHEVVQLSGMRRTIARRLTESKQQVPHVYLTVDVRLDALLKLRAELNASLESREVRLSVNDMLIKALGLALMQVPKCNVSFVGDQILMYSRADISVAVSLPNGLITPIITDVANKSISVISTEMATLVIDAKGGNLPPHKYQGGTASLSNLGMKDIRQFDAVINPPQGMIMAIGAGEKRPWIVNNSLAIATILCATGGFDHRAIDGVDGAMLMKVFKELVENPLGLVA